LLGVTTIAAQQSAVSRQKSPRLTTDDVAQPPVVEQPAETKPALKTDAAGKTVAAETKPGEAKPGEPKTDPEEASWREQVAKARTKAKELERAAEEAELRITTLRNQLGVSGESARHRNDTAAELEQAGQQVIVVRGQARVAADDLAQLVEYGRHKGFSEAADPKPTEDGKANEEYYRTRFARLNEAVETAQRRISLYENRVRDLSQQLLSKGAGQAPNGRRTGGDSFFAPQLIKDRDEAQQKLEEARSAATKAQA